MSRQQHHFHGVPERFDIVAEFISDEYGHSIRYIADVAGGQGMLTRILNKRYNYECEVIDPRGWVLKGVPNRQEEFSLKMADYYDLIVGLHPDEATREVVWAALFRPVVLIPCCNFWSEEKLGREELLQAIEHFYQKHGIKFRRKTFSFRGPKNIGLVSEPPDVHLDSAQSIDAVE